MDTLDDFLDDLGLAGVRLWEEQGEICYDGPASVLTTGVLDRLSGSREVLLRRLSPTDRPRIIPAGVEHARMWRSMKGLRQPDVWMNAFYAYTEVRLDLERLKAAAADVVARHESLRAGFAETDEGLIMTIHPEAAAEVELIDMADDATGDPRQLHECCIRFAAEPMPLDQPPLLRLAVARHDRDGQPDDVLFLVFHHIVADGFSLGIIGSELGACYRARQAGMRASLPEPQPLEAFLQQEHRRRRTTGPAAVAARAAELSGAPVWPSFPPDPNADPASVDNANLRTLSQAESRLFREAARQSGVSEFAVMLAAFNVLVTELTGEPDVVVAVSAACRSPEFAGTVGLLRRHLPVRLHAEPGDSWASLARRILRLLGRAMDGPLLALEDVCEVRPATGGTGDVFSILISHLQEMDLSIDLGGGHVRWTECPMPGSHAGLGILTRTDDGVVSAGLEAAASVAAPATRVRWLNRLIGLLMEAARHMDGPLPLSRPLLFCIPFAGGSPRDFDPLREALHPAIDVVVSASHGRDEKVPHESFTAAVDAIANHIERHAGDRPYAIYGHSLGGLLGYEVVRRLTARGFHQPEHLFISASRAPQRPYGRGDTPAIHRYPDLAFLGALAAVGGVPEGLLHRPEAVAYFAARIRRDYELYAGYMYAGPEPRPSCPLTLITGVDDPTNGSRDVGLWAEVTTGPFSHHELNGAGHFFVASHSSVVAAWVCAALEGVARNTETNPPR